MEFQSNLLIWIFFILYFTIQFSIINARTFHRNLHLDIFNQDRPGKLYDVQDRTFEFEKLGTINVSVTCDPPLSGNWDDRIKFNVFLCTENPKTNWLYLYPEWGMCFEGKHDYHHCSILPLTKVPHSTTWHFSHTVQTDMEYVVLRVRKCPIYKYTTTAGSQPAPDGHLVNHFMCDYIGIFLNPSTRLSMDELWNPWIYRLLSILYGLFLFKSAYETMKYWEYRVNFSFIIYSYVAMKFLNLQITAWYYERIVSVGDLSASYENYELMMALTLSAKFAIYYVILVMLSHGYCIYNTELMFGHRTYITFGCTVFCFFLYMMLMRDSYMEIACVIISCAVLASLLSLVWAFYFKRVALIRYAFFVQTPDFEQHTIARYQIKKKETLVAIGFFQILLFLVFMIVYEFYTAETFPIPGTTGVLVIETLDLVLIVPLLFTFNMRDLSKYYPTPKPPPIIHVIKTPDEGYKISLCEHSDKHKMGYKTELSINETTSEFHIIHLPSRSNSDFSIQPEDS